jgi:hypothetical protein
MLGRDTYLRALGCCESLTRRAQAHAFPFGTADNWRVPAVFIGCWVSYFSSILKCAPLVGKPSVNATLSILWSLVAVTSVFAEEPLKDAIAPLERSYFASIENDIKEEFERGVADVEQNTGNSSKQELDAALAAMKMLSYNKANIHAACMGEAVRSKTPTETLDNVATHYKSCVVGRLGEMLVFYTLATSSGRPFIGKGEGRCETKARLFERERLLPPYEFLKGDGVALLDFRVLNQCLKSKL